MKRLFLQAVCCCAVVGSVRNLTAIEIPTRSPRQGALRALATFMLALPVITRARPKPMTSGNLADAENNIAENNVLPSPSTKGENSIDFAADKLSVDIPKILQEDPDWDMFADDFKLMYRNGASVTGVGASKVLLNQLRGLRQVFGVEDDIRVGDASVRSYPFRKVSWKGQLDGGAVIEADSVLHLDPTTIKVDYWRFDSVSLNGKRVEWVDSWLAGDELSNRMKDEGLSALDKFDRDKTATGVIFAALLTLGASSSDSEYSGPFGMSVDKLSTDAQNALQDLRSKVNSIGSEIESGMNLPSSTSDDEVDDLMTIVQDVTAWLRRLPTKK